MHYPGPGPLSSHLSPVVPFYNWLPIKPVYVPKFSEMAILRVSDKVSQISWQFCFKISPGCTELCLAWLRPGPDTAGDVC